MNKSSDGPAAFLTFEEFVEAVESGDVSDVWIDENLITFEFSATARHTARSASWTAS